MEENQRKLVENLNHPHKQERLSALRELAESINEPSVKNFKGSSDVNNHIHTFYSFSPYSPAKAVWMAYESGLITAGIMDHDSLGGAQEFVEAGRIMGIATTIGVECRVDFSDTPLQGRRINNPDQTSIAYVALHGIPHTEIEAVMEYFKTYTAERNKRNQQMVDRINNILCKHGVSIGFEKDVIPLSQFHDGGSITERHILYALGEKLIQRFGRGDELLSFLQDVLGLNVSEKNKGYLRDSTQPFYLYDLLGVLKSDMVSRFYVDAKAECPSVQEIVQKAKEWGAVLAYAYLGDVGDSITGDKKSQKFEDDYIELLFEVIKDLGFNAVTYMPSRNTMSQLMRLKKLCQEYDFFQISGEDINSPRQSFVCEALRKEEFSNLIDAAWALIGHEKEATEDKDKGMFSESTLRRLPDLDSRIQKYKRIGLSE